MKKILNQVIYLVLVMGIIFSSVGLDRNTASAAIVSKKAKSYEIAVVFDNSGSMYNNQAWCRAKYAMEIFASMLNYDNGDILKIFPMWAVATDGSKPTSGGDYSAITIKASDDINKISNLYTISPSNTPFAPVLEAHQELQKSGASEKWLIVLTDGAFNEEERGQDANIELQSRLLQLASENIKVQYLGMGAAEDLAADESKHLYSKKSTDISLKDDLIGICNTIFQRSVLPGKYINGQSVNLDLSMKSLIVFAQGADAKIIGLKNPEGKNVAVKLDSGQRKYSTISAGAGASKDYSNAPVDASLAGQVVTFDACPKGTYTLEYSGAEAIQIFYEPDVDIKATLINSDGEEVDYTKGEIAPGEYTVNYGIVDANTGEEVTKSELMGNDVHLTSKIRTSDGTETEFQNGGKIMFNPDDATQIIINGTYLKDYTISTEDDPTLFPVLKVNLPDKRKLKISLSTEQGSSWYQLGKENDWKPIKANITLDGEPLTDEQLSALNLQFDFSKDIKYVHKIIPGESAYEIVVAQDETGNFVEPKTGKYSLKAVASFTDEFGQVSEDKDKFNFTVQRYNVIWRWLKWVVIFGIILLLLAFILTRKAWPKEMYLDCRGGLNDIEVDEDMNVASNLFPGVLPCTAKKHSMLYQRFGRAASVKLVDVSPMYDVTSFKIGSSAKYMKTTSGFVDGGGKPFKEVIIRNRSKIVITRSGKPTIEGYISMNGK